MNGWQVRHTRIELGYTQEEFARRIGVSRSTISNIELNKGIQYPKTIEAIKEFLSENKKTLKGPVRREEPKNYTDIGLSVKEEKKRGLIQGVGNEPFKY